MENQTQADADVWHAVGTFRPGKRARWPGSIAGNTAWTNGAADVAWKCHDRLCGRPQPPSGLPAAVAAVHAECGNRVGSIRGWQDRGTRGLQHELCERSILYGCGQRGVGKHRVAGLAFEPIPRADDEQSNRADSEQSARRTKSFYSSVSNPHELHDQCRQPGHPCSRVRDQSRPECAVYRTVEPEYREKHWVEYLTFGQLLRQSRSGIVP